MKPSIKLYMTWINHWRSNAVKNIRLVACGQILWVAAFTSQLQPLPGGVQTPTSDLTAFAIGGIEVNSTVIVPNRLIERLDSAAALGSVRSSKAVATADELAPSVTPRVT